MLSCHTNLSVVLAPDLHDLFVLICLCSSFILPQFRRRRIFAFSSTHCLLSFGFSPEHISFSADDCSRCYCKHTFLISWTKYCPGTTDLNNKSSPSRSPYVFHLCIFLGFHWLSLVVKYPMQFLIQMN